MNTVVWPIIGQTGRCETCGLSYAPERLATHCPGRDAFLNEWNRRSPATIAKESRPATADLFA